MSEPILNTSGRGGNRFYDALRPSVYPVGVETPEAVRELRTLHLAKVRQMFETLDVFIFTLGLTEVWLSSEDGTAFPTAPGVIAGDIENNPVKFSNLNVTEVCEDMSRFWQLLKGVNSTARMILTVSPVPLIATASGNHVLPATMYSKSVLRAAAGEMAKKEDISYFPSYEIINSAQGRGYYFDPDLRTVNERGVRYVMSHFFTGSLLKAFPEYYSLDGFRGGVVCDEFRLEI